MNGGIGQWRKNYEQGEGNETERYNRGELDCRVPAKLEGYLMMMKFKLRGGKNRPPQWAQRLEET